MFFFRKERKKRSEGKIEATLKPDKKTPVVFHTLQEVRQVRRTATVMTAIIN